MPERALPAVTFPVTELCDRLGADWPHLTGSRARSGAMRRRLTRELRHLVPPETSLVV